MAPSVTCIVLNWNSKLYIEACLTSLLASEYEEVRFLVIDNASTDGSVEFINNHFPEISVIRNDTNLGFAGGNNVALAELDSEFAVLVNPDVTVEPDWLSNLILPLSDDQSIGIAGCKTYYPGGERLQHAGGFIEYPRATPGHQGLAEEDEGQYDNVTDVEYVTGAAFALRREVLRDVGLFDEGYFLYYEEADLCLRARNAGYRVVLNAEASAVHVESAVAMKGSRFFHVQMHTSRWRYLLKHYSIDSLVDETFPAERRWLDHITPEIRRAVSQAYRKNRRDLPFILKRREKETGQAIPESQQERLGQVLDNLRRYTIHLDLPDKSDLAQISAMASVQAKPFQSELPIIGGLVAFSRDLWSRIAVKPFVTPLLDQQNDINKLLVERFSDSIRMLEEKDQLQSDRVVSMSDSVAQIRKLNETFIQLDRRIELLERTDPGQDDGDGQS